MSFRSGAIATPHFTGAQAIAKPGCRQSPSMARAIGKIISLKETGKWCGWGAHELFIQRPASSRMSPDAEAV